jgi:integrase
MAASLKPARLWLRAARGTRQAAWIILDKGKQFPTSCRENDLAGAQDALAAHIAATHRPAAPKSGNPADLPVSDVLTVYMQDKQQTVASPAELGQRVSALLDYFGEMTLGQVNASTSRVYAERRKSPSMARRELEDLGAAITHAQKNVEPPLLPSGWRPIIVMPPKAAPRLRWLTRSEAAKLIWAAWRYRETQKGKLTDRASRQHVARFILVGLYTGTRSSAICGAALTEAIGRGYVDLENGFFYRRGLGVAETNKRQPPIKIPDRLLAHMRRWRKLRLSNTAVIEYEGEPVGSVRKAFARAAADAGLAKVTPHTLRHTAISWAVQKEADIYKTAKFFGLTVEMIERVYGHLAPGNEVGDAITGRGQRR